MLPICGGWGLAIGSDPAESRRLDVLRAIDDAAPEIRALAEAIGRDPELGLNEVRAVERLRAALARHEIPCRTGVAGLPTAFRATVAGNGRSPHVGLLAEYDALPGIGHGCGHNIIAASAVGAAIGLAAIGSEIAGSVTLFGTPAEESAVDNAGGKVHLVRDGAFRGVDAALMVHPHDETLIAIGGSLAARGVDFAFHGRAAHAAAGPHLGINALDAVIQTFNGINALRQHVRDDVRLHGIVTAGGASPNIVPDYAACRFRVRARDRRYLQSTFERTVACAEGAARATGARLEWREYVQAYDEYRHNRTLGDAFRSNLERLGIRTGGDRDEIWASTDFGNVSQVVPGLHAFVQVAPPGTRIHTVEFARAALSPAGLEAAVWSAKALALTALDVLTDETVRRRVQAEFRAEGETR